MQLCLFASLFLSLQKRIVDHQNHSREEGGDIYSHEGVSDIFFKTAERVQIFAMESRLGCDYGSRRVALQRFHEPRLRLEQLSIVVQKSSPVDGNYDADQGTGASKKHQTQHSVLVYVNLERFLEHESNARQQ